MSTKKLQIIGSMGNSDADTLDGKHASDFASASDVTELQSLVGDTTVSEQISNAVKVESAYFDENAEATEGSSTPLDADTLGGVLPSGYVTQSELNSATNTINGDLANNYYTKTEVDGISAELESSISENANNISNLETSLSSDITALETNVTTNYLLKTETAADSNLLGGKAPIYYIQPRNLLDNSDFSNPVNQRYATSYADSVSPIYSIDRWICHVGSTVTVNSGSSVVVSGYIRQRLSSLKDGTYTAVSKATNGFISTFNFIKSGETISATASYGESVYCIWDEGVEFGLNTGEYIWAALYEGEYTVDTLPPYVSKGYAVEFAECQRYFKRIGGTGTTFVGYGGVYSSANKQLFITIPNAGGMRTNPSVSTSGTVRCFSDVGTAYEISSVAVGSQDAFSHCLIVTMAAALDGGKVYLCRTDTTGYIDFSADL